MKIKCDLFLCKNCKQIMQERIVARSSITWGREAKTESLVEMVTFGVYMIPCLLWKSYHDDKRLIFGETIASIICYVKNIKLWKNSRISWDDLYMHQVMFNVSCSGLEDLGRNTLKISYGAWRMSSYHMVTVLSE